MSLKKYQSKRDFGKTPEPTGGKADSSSLSFVVQEHQASQLHYDFRLEMNGVLKSWAVPKGPSMDHSVKRLAVMVEDHPLDYRNFEGSIPSGYGAGSVIIWDEGRYEPIELEGKPKDQQEKLLLEELRSGKIKFVLHGQKLKGKFTLLKAFGKEENNWLLIKMDDEFDSRGDILQENKSVVSGKILNAATSDGQFLDSQKKSQVVTVNRHRIELTHLDKIYWPKEGYTKRDVLNYYHSIAEYILPYLKDRPLSLNRFPNGIDGDHFYQKDVTGKVPDWAKTHLYHAGKDETDKHFLVGNDEATLLWAANSGCIEMNPWNSTIQKPDNPDYCIIDLDPDQQSFDQVIEAALATKTVLDELNIPSFVKTSGSTGMHIFIPLGAKYHYDISKQFAKAIVSRVHERCPDFTTLERNLAARKGKMYLDFLQNRPQATIASVYSIRPKPYASVSTPLHWEEVKKGLKTADFTIKSTADRLKEMGDIFRGIFDQGIILENIDLEFNASEK